MPTKPVVLTTKTYFLRITGIIISQLSIIISFSPPSAYGYGARTSQPGPANKNMKNMKG